MCLQDDEQSEEAPIEAELEYRASSLWVQEFVARFLKNPERIEKRTIAIVWYFLYELFS